MRWWIVFLLWVVMACGKSSPPVPPTAPEVMNELHLTILHRYTLMPTPKDSSLPQVSVAAYTSVQDRQDRFNAYRHATTDTQGVALLGGLPDDTYYLLVSDSLRGVLEETVVLENGGREFLTLRFGP